MMGMMGMTGYRRGNWGVGPRPFYAPLMRNGRRMGPDRSKTVLKLDASGTAHYTSAVQSSPVSTLRAGKRGSVIFRGMPCRGGVN